MLISLLCSFILPLISPNIPNRAHTNVCIINMMTLILVPNCCHNVDSDLHGYMLWGSQYFFCFIISFLVNHFKTIVFKVLDVITERSYSYYDLLILKYFCSKAPAWLSKLAPADALVMQEEAWNAYPRCKSGLPFPLDSTLCVTCFSLSLFEYLY